MHRYFVVARWASPAGNRPGAGGHLDTARGLLALIDLPDSALELRSLVTSQGTLELSLHDVPIPTLAADEVLGAWKPRRSTPIAFLIAGADMTTAMVAGTPERPVVTESLGAGALEGLSARVDFQWE